MRCNFKYGRYGLSLYTLFSMVPVEYAWSADATQLEEIVVTAERREVDVQKVATSVSVRNGDDLLKQGRGTLAQVLEDVVGLQAELAVPGANAAGEGQGGSIVIRGASTNGGAPGGGGTAPVAATALYTDGIIEGIGSDYDLERVEVLRGPQGTLYGRSATGGVVANYTRNPTLGSYSGYFMAGAGNYNLRNLQGAVNIPLGEQLAMRVSGQNYVTDGYGADKGQGYRKIVSGRIKALYKPSDEFSLLVGVATSHSHTGSGDGTYTETSPGHFEFTPPAAEAIGSGYNRFQQYWAQVDWNLGFATLTYLPALRKWYQDTHSKMPFPPGGAGAFIDQPYFTPKDDFVTHELRLASNPGSKLAWQTGVLYYNNKIETSTSANVRPDPTFGTIWESGAIKETENLGAFAEGTYSFTDALRLTAGLRYDYTKVQTSQTYTQNNNPVPWVVVPPNFSTGVLSGDAGRKTFKDVTYKLRGEMDLTDRNLMYVSVSTGVLPGDVNATTGSSGIPEAAVYEAETLTAYEIGSKNRFMDNKLQVNASAFFYDYGGYQSIINVNASGGPFNPVFVTVTEPAHMWGGEVETIYQLTSNDRLNASVSHTRGTYTEPSAAFSASIVQTYFTGLAPWQATAGYSHRFDLPDGSTLVPAADARWRDGYDLTGVSPGNIGKLSEVQIDAQWLFNANLTWTAAGERFYVNGYVRNITDNRSRRNVDLNGALPTITRISDPRTYGATIGVNF